MVIKYQLGYLNPANSLSCCSDYEKEDKSAALTGTLQDATESVSWLSQKHLGESVGRKWNRTQTIVLSPSTSDGVILTYFSMPVDPKQGKAPKNTSDSGEASLQVLIQNAYSSTAQEQESLMFSASTKRALFGQRLKKARQKKKTLISNFSFADMPTEEPQRSNNVLWQFCLKRSENLQPLMSRSNIKQIAKEETAYSKPSIELCTVLQVLQEVDPLLKWKRLHFTETRLVEQSVDRASAGVLAMIVKETADLTSDFP